MPDATNEDMENGDNGATQPPNLGEMILRGMKTKLDERKKVVNASLLKKSDEYSKNLINRLVEIAATHPKKTVDDNDLYSRNLSLNEKLYKMSDDLKNFSNDDE